MKALQITEVRKTQTVDLDVPKPSSGEVLLKTGKVGFCGSDLSTFVGRNPLVELPRIPGHEIVAQIVELGPDIPENIQIGDITTVLPYTHCGHCTSCLRGHTNACRYNQTLGIQRDGAMAEYLAVPWEKLVPAQGLPEDKLILVEPLSVGFHAVQRADVSDVDAVAVFGCGMIGIGALLRCLLRGARTIAVDVDDEKLEIVESLGCNLTVNARTEDLHAVLSDMTGGHGPDVIVEAVGSPATYRSAVEESAFAGRVVCIGYAKEDARLTTRLIVQKELSIRGSRNATILDFIAVRNFLVNAEFPAERLITRQVTLAEAQDALEYWADNPGKVIKLVSLIGG